MKWGSKFGPRLGSAKYRTAQHLWDPILGPFFAEICLGRPPRAAKSLSQLLFFGSQSVQERSKRLPIGFLKLSASKMRFGTHFGPVFGVQTAPRGLQKSLKFIELSVKFKVSLFSARVACGTQFGTLPGSVFGAFWPSRWLKPVLKFVLDRPRAVQDYFFSAPSGKKKGSKKGAKKGTQKGGGRESGADPSGRGFRESKLKFGREGISLCNASEADH